MGPTPPLPLAWPSATLSGASQAFLTPCTCSRASQPFPRLPGHVHPALWPGLAPLHSWRRSRSMNCHGQHFGGVLPPSEKVMGLSGPRATAQLRRGSPSYGRRKAGAGLCQQE